MKNLVIVAHPMSRGSKHGLDRDEAKAIVEVFLEFVEIQQEDNIDRLCKKFNTKTAIIEFIGDGPYRTISLKHPSEDYGGMQCSDRPHSDTCQMCKYLKWFVLGYQACRLSGND